MRKIGELKGKPIIEGNPNEIKKNQIHYKESDGGITLSERKEDNTLSSVTSGSGSGEGVKEYYYKIINEQAGEIIKTYPYILISGIIDSGKYEYVYAPHLGTTNFLAFRIADIEMTYWGYIEYNKVDRGVILRGNLYERISLGITAAGNPMSVEDVKNQFGSMLKEITKEEYESMITYKPE